MSDERQVDPPTLDQFLKFVESIKEERRSSKGVLRLDDAEMLTMLKMLRGDGDKTLPVMARLNALEANDGKKDRVLHGPAGEPEKGLVARVTENTKAVAIWIRVQWLVGGAVIMLLSKMFFDRVAAG